MIDADFEFGAYRPKVPSIYKIQATVDESSSCNNDELIDDYSSRSDYTDILSCAISKSWKSYKLLSKQPYNHDTCLFEFALEDMKQQLRLPVTAHLLIRVPILPSTSSDGHNSHENSFHEYKADQTSLTYHVRPYTSISPLQQKGSFTLMIKRYDSWGTPEKILQKQHEQQMQHYVSLDSNDSSSSRPVYYYTKTDHSYKPPGLVSTYIHKLEIGQEVEMKFALPDCLGKIPYPFPRALSISAITMIAVGVGIAPMIRILRALLDDETTTNEDNSRISRIRLLYGVRTVDDILQRPIIDEWHHRYNYSTSIPEQTRFRVMYCIGSRWANIHFGAKTRNRTGPPLPKGYEGIPSDCKCLGWVDGDKVTLYGAASPQDPSHFVFICGLPGVYRDLVGKRSDPELCPQSQLARLGFSSSRVVKF